MRGDARAGRAQWVADGNCTAAHVGLFIVEAQFLLARQKLRRERFVHLDEVHFIQGAACGSQGLFYGRHGANAHDVRVATGSGESDNAGEGAQIMCLNQNVVK